MIVEKLQLYGDDMLISNYKSEDTASTGSEVSATKAAICSASSKLLGWIRHNAHTWGTRI